MAAPFDLLVFGQTTRDVLSTSSLNAERIGGVAYAASVAARLGLRVGLLASVSDTSEGTIRTALEGRGIDTDGLCSKAQSPLIYEISGGGTNAWTSGQGGWGPAQGIWPCRRQCPTPTAAQKWR